MGTHNCGMLTVAKAMTLAATARALDLDIVALQEVGRPGDEVVAAFSAAGFRCVWSPRADVVRPSGGTGFAVSAARCCPPLVLGASCSEVEYVVIEVRSTVGNAVLRLASVYAAPDSDVRPLAPAAFSHALAAALRRWGPDVCLGDFNARHTSWDPFLVGAGQAAQRGAHLLTDTRALGLRVVAPTLPTRVRGTAQSVLDFAVCAAHVQAAPVGEPLACGSDHLLVSFAVSAGGVSPPSFAVPWAPLLRVAWRNVTPEMRQQAGKDIEACLARRGLPRTPNCATAYFVDVARRCTAHFPRVLPGHHAVCAPAVRVALAAADRAWGWVESARHCGVVAPALDAHAALCTARLEAAVSHAVAHPGSTGPAFSGAEAWRLLRSATELHVPLPAAIGTWRTERAMAEGFADLFAAKSAGDDVPVVLPPAEPPPPIVPSEVAMAVAAFSRGKATDPDGLDAEHLQLLGPVGHQWLAGAFDLCLRQGLPGSWKESLVVPVPKPGKPADEASSYRPVSLTSVLCRALERIVLARVLAGRWRLAQTQFGFRPGSSTEDAIAYLAMALADAAALQTTSLVVGVDMTDAFCRVRCSSFVREYRRLGFPLAYLPFFVGFLSGRSFRVRVGGRVSGVRVLLLGAPQGSVSGPFFWAVVMDPLARDLDRQLRAVPGTGIPRARVIRNISHRWCGSLQYADDGVIWLSGIDVTALVRGANDALVLVASFCSREGIALSKKSSAILVGAPHDAPLQVTCGDIVVDVKTAGSTERVLGAHFDTRLRMDQHTEKAVARGHKVLGDIASIRRLLSAATTRELVYGAALSPVVYATASFGTLLRSDSWRQLDAFMIACARLITDAVQSAPTTAVLAEAGIPPARFLVSRRATLLCERIVRRDPLCPLRRLLLSPPTHTTSRIATLRGAIAPETLRLSPSQMLPLLHPRVLPVCDTTGCVVVSGPPAGLRKDAPVERRLEAVAARVASLPADVVCYCDASVCEPTETSPRMSSGAAIVTGAVTLQVTRAFGEFACSFTAEAKILTAVLSELVDAAQVRQNPRWSTVAIFTDSQSCLAALARGPGAAPDALIVRIWELLVSLLSCGVRPTLAFVFGHVGFPPHDA